MHAALGSRSTCPTTATPCPSVQRPLLMQTQAVCGGMLGSVYTIVTSYLINHNEELREPITLSKSTAGAPCSLPSVLTAQTKETGACSATTPGKWTYTLP